MLRSKKQTPAAMIAALHDICPLGHEIAQSDAGKAELDKMIDGASSAWKTVQKRSAGDDSSAKAGSKVSKVTATKDAADAGADAAKDAADAGADAAGDALDQGHEAGNNAANTVSGWFHRSAEPAGTGG